MGGLAWLNFLLGASLGQVILQRENQCTTEGGSLKCKFPFKYEVIIFLKSIFFLFLHSKSNPLNVNVSIQAFRNPASYTFLGRYQLLKINRRKESRIRQEYYFLDAIASLLLARSVPVTFVQNGNYSKHHDMTT